MAKSPEPSPKEQKAIAKNTIQIEPGTLVLIIGVLLLLPLLWIGFSAQ